MLQKQINGDITVTKKCWNRYRSFWHWRQNCFFIFV